MLSISLEITLKNAFSIASEYRHEYVTQEHLLLALIDDNDARLVLIKNRVSLKKLASKLKYYLVNESNQISKTEPIEIKPTLGFQRIVQRSTIQSSQINDATKQPANGGNILSEFFFEHDCYALSCLKEYNITRNDIIKSIKEIKQKNNNEAKKDKHKKQLSIIKKETKDQQKHNELPPMQIIINKSNKNDENNNDQLSKYCVNLNYKAYDEAIDCLVGRKNVVLRTIEIICRRKKNNEILVGEPGDGKTAIAEGLAFRIVTGDVPNILKNTTIYSLDLASLVAGTKYRGDFEERVRHMLDTIKSQPNTILLIDEIHTLIGAGSTNHGSLDASNLLKPALARGEIRCIGSTTFKEYHNYFEKDMALVRRFQKVIIDEPSSEETIAILQGLKQYYEKHHSVKYSDQSLKAAINLSERYISNRHLPDKAIDLMDEAGSRKKIDTTNNKVPIVTESDMESIITTMLNIPNIGNNLDNLKQLKNLENNLKNNIYGQNEAIKDLCSTIKLSIAGLKKGTRPTGCYLFAGKTGVGKTELAKQLAIHGSMKLVRFDMSEFSESISVSKLLGSAPGYIGYDQGGLLTEEVGKYPYSVVLFDEIEKAHHDIYNLLLQIMDDGKLTDSTGKVIDFRHSLIILTTNIGSNNNNSIGFSTNKSSRSIKSDLKEINSKFSAEFIGRLDKIILFNPIDNIIDKIIDKNFKDMKIQLKTKNITIRVSKKVKFYLINNFFDINKGARDIDRIMDVKIKQPIAEEILFGKLKNGGRIEIELSKKEDSIIFKYSKSSPSSDLEMV